MAEDFDLSFGLSLLEDPDFLALPPAEQMKGRRKIAAAATRDPDFKALPPEEQFKGRREILFGPEPERERPSTLARIGGRMAEGLSLGIVQADLPPAETIGETLTDVGGFVAGETPGFAASALLGVPGGTALAARLLPKLPTVTRGARAATEALKLGSTGVVHETLKGAAQQRPALETAEAIGQRLPTELLAGAALGGATRPPPSGPRLSQQEVQRFGQQARQSIAEEEAQAEAEVLRQFRAPVRPEPPRLASEEEMVGRLIEAGKRPPVTDLSRGTMELRPTPKRPGAVPTEQVELPLSGSVKERELPFGFQPRVVPKGKVPEEALTVGGKEGQLDRFLERAQGAPRAPEIPTLRLREPFGEGGEIRGERMGARIVPRPGEPLGVTGRIREKDVERFIETGTTNPKPRSIARQLGPEAEAQITAIQEAVGQEAMGDLNLLFRRGAIGAEPTLRKMGRAGNAYADALHEAFSEAKNRQGAIRVGIEKIFRQHSPELRENLWKQVESGNFTPEGRQAYNDILRLSRPIAQEAEQLGVAVESASGVRRPFKGLELFFPRKVDPSKVGTEPWKNAQLKAQVIQDLVADGMNPGKAESAAVMVLRNMSKRSGSLQFSRTRPEFDPKLYMTDSQEAYIQALQGEAERLAYLKRFGVRGKDGLLGNERGGLDDFVARIRQEAGDRAAEAARTWGLRMMGLEESRFREIFGRWAQGFRNFQALKLSFLPVMNAAQTAITLAHSQSVGLSPFRALSAYTRAFGESPEASDLAKRLMVATGRTIDDTLGKFEVGTGPLGREAHLFLKGIGGLKSEHFIEKLASNLGWEDTKLLIEQYLANPTSRRLARTLRWYNLDPQRVLKEGPSEDLLFRGAKTFADKMLLRGNVLTLPPAFTAESGRFILQFQRASQQLGKVMLDDLRYRPEVFGKMLLVGQAAGEVIEDLKAVRRGALPALAAGNTDAIVRELRRRPTDARRLINNYAAAGTFGWWGDQLTDAINQADAKGIVLDLGGPSGATLVSALEAGFGAARIAGAPFQPTPRKQKEELAKGARKVARPAVRELAAPVAPFVTPFLREREPRESR